jgi:very-short-patch-repair endonuclease
VVMGSGKSRLAIEIDGYEFHEKTKVQARNDRQRERAIMRAGHPVYRFTGSEVFANARSCVEEVVAYLDTAE